MRLIALSVKRPIATLMFFVGVLLLGYISLRNLTVDLLPSLSYPKLTVITEYPGAGPQEVEKMITQPLESELSSIPSLRKINSTSREGISIITLQFHWGTDMDFALLHARERVEEASEQLPSDCSKPLIVQWDPSSRPILVFVLEGGEGGQLRDTALYLVKPRLERLKGIARVEVRGGGSQEIVVQLDPQKMARYGVGFQDVENAISSYNQLVLSGTVRKNKIRYVVKVEGELKKPSEINEIPVKDLGFRTITVQDIGRAFMGESPKQGEIRFNGKASLALLVFKESGANTLQATFRVKEEIQKIEREFPGLRFKTISEDAALITSAINSIKYSIYIGAVLAFLVLVLFLRNLRDPALVALVIPISVISTFVLMFFTRVNVNIMSLGGLALGVGMFVDNSIVVLESMFRHRREKSAEEAAIDGASEVAGAITAATLTTIVIFLPVIYIYGIAGRLFRDLALTVSFSLLSSLFVSLTLLPSLFAFFAREKRATPVKTSPGKRKTFWEKMHFILSLPFLGLFKVVVFIFKGVFAALRAALGFAGNLLSRVAKPILDGFQDLYGWFDEKYHDFLQLCFERKTIPFLIGLFMFLFIILSFPFLKKELLPSPSTQKFEISAEAPPTFGFEGTDELARKIEHTLLGRKSTRFVFSQIGAVSKFSAGEEALSVEHIEMLVGTADREGEMKWTRKFLKGIEGLRFSVFPERNTLSRYLRLGAESFQLKVFYRFEEYGRKAVREVIEKLSGVEGLSDLRTNAFYSRPMISVRFKDEIIKNFGLSRREVADLIEAAFRGRKVITIKRFQKTYDVVLTSPLREKKELEALLSLPVSVKDRAVPLGNFVELKEELTPGEITRENQERYFLISGDLEENLAEVSRRVTELLSSLVLPPEVRLKIGGAEEERRRAFRSIYEALLLAVILVYMVMASQFENLIHPLIIMITIPMGLFGGFLFLLLTGQSLNVISGIGFMVMAGIVVNDAIVKVDYANKLRKRGLSARQAMLEASRVRLRPILMTTFTTIFGLLPMALMRMTGSELQRPLAVVVIGGLLASTFLTLILIPVLYEMVSQKK